MIKWLKTLLGIDELQAQLTTLQTERDTLAATIKERNEAVEELTQELSVFRKQEEENNAKYQSDEPWVEIRSEDFSEKRGFRIELDWNDAFIRQLKEAGIKGTNDEEIVQKWLAMLYQNLIERLETTAIEKKDEQGTVSDYV